MSFQDGKAAGRPRSFAYSRRSFDSPGVRNGVHVLKRLPGIEYCRPSWNKTETVIRIFPGLNPDNPQEFDHYRVAEELGRFGVWQCCYEAVRKFGEPGVTFLLHDNSDPHYNPYSMNPCWIIYRAIKDACEKGQGKPEWFPLLQRASNRGQALCPPTEIVLVQGALFRHNSKNLYDDGKPPFGAGPGDPTVVFELSKSAADKMFGLFEERVDGWHGDPDDPTSYKYGDPVSVDDGVFVHVYEEGTDLSTKAPVSQGAPTSVYAARPSAAKSRQKTSFGYTCSLTKTLDGGPGDIPASLTGHEQMVRTKWKPWENILEFMSDTQQAHLINPLFPPSAIMYAFRDHRDWILEETRSAAVGKTTFDMAPPAMPVNPASAALAAQASWGAPPTGFVPQNAPVQLPPEMNTGTDPFGDQVEDVVVPTGVISSGPSTAMPTTTSAAKAEAMKAVEEARQRALARSRG